MKNWLRNLTLALDRFLNVLLFFGRADETISYNAAIAEKKGKKWGCMFCKFLHWVDHGHCARTLRNEETGDDAGLRFLALLLVVFYVIMRIV
jgi:hypothetical protein